jgi:hypothetical protein
MHEGTISGVSVETKAQIFIIPFAWIPVGRIPHAWNISHCRLAEGRTMATEVLDRDDQLGLRSMVFALVLFLALCYARMGANALVLEWNGGG